jgi:hypothetical protein
MRETVPSYIRIKCDTCGKEIDKAVSLTIKEPNEHCNATRALDLCLLCWSKIEIVIDMLKIEPIKKDK